MQVAITMLCVASAAFGLLWAGYHQPYTAQAPKKVYLYHVHDLDKGPGPGAGALHLGGPDAGRWAGAARPAR